MQGCRLITVGVWDILDILGMRKSHAMLCKKSVRHVLWMWESQTNRYVTIVKWINAFHPFIVEWGEYINFPFTKNPSKSHNTICVWGENSVTVLFCFPWNGFHIFTMGRRCAQMLTAFRVFTETDAGQTMNSHWRSLNYVFSFSHVKRIVFWAQSCKDHTENLTLDFSEVLMSAWCHQICALPEKKKETTQKCAAGFLWRVRHGVQTTVESSAGAKCFHSENMKNVHGRKNELLTSFCSEYNNLSVVPDVNIPESAC